MIKMKFNSREKEKEEKKNEDHRFAFDKQYFIVL